MHHFNQIPTSPVGPKLSAASIKPPSLGGSRKALLDALWRDDKRGRMLASRGSRSAAFKHHPVQSTMDAATLAATLDQQGEDCYFACAVFADTSCRKADNAVGAYSFWIDVDCGADKAAAGKGYATQSVARDALMRTCSALNLPAPNWIINSGRGLHCYWVLGAFVEKLRWQATAQALKAVFAEAGFLVDQARTADIASILRVPGTHNRKSAEALPVTVIQSASDFLDGEGFIAAVARAGARDSASSPAAPLVGAAATATPGADQHERASFDQLESALRYLDPDCEEPTWKFYRIAPLANEARRYPDDSHKYKELAKAWSRGEFWATPSKYWTETSDGTPCDAERVFEKSWRNLMTSPQPARPATVGTIFKDARDLGWSYDRRAAKKQPAPSLVAPSVQPQPVLPTAAQPLPQSTGAPSAPAIASKASSSSGKGNGPFWEHEPWHEPVVPAELLSEISATLRRFVIITPEQADAAALWVAHTHFIAVLDTSPLALIDAPERACAKSLVLEIFAAMSSRALPAANASVAAVYRAIERWGCALFIDEADTFFKDNKELHGVFNAGYERTGTVLRVEAVGDSFEPRAFPVYGAKAIAGIALSRHLPDATMSRGIVFSMRRKLKTEKVERMRSGALAQFRVLGSKLARFAKDYADKVRDACPQLPDELSDRAQDNWEPLLMVASCGGDEWVQRAEAAANNLSAAVEVQGSASNSLLADVRYASGEPILR